VGPFCVLVGFFCIFQQLIQTEDFHAGNRDESIIVRQKGREKIELARMRSRQEYTLEEFVEAKEACTLEILDIEENIRSLNECKSASESFARLAQLQIFDLAHIWTIAKPDQKQRVQNLLFEGGLEYSE